MTKLFGVGSSPRSFEFKCEQCKEIHRGSPSFSYASPFIPQLSDEEYARRVELSDDLCRVLPVSVVVNASPEYWIRVILEIPILGAKEPFTWGVWVTQSEDSFNRYRDTFDDDQSDDGSFGWLPNNLPVYSDQPLQGEIDSFPCDVYWGPIGRRPKLVLHDVDHPLYRDQNEGVSWDRAIELAQITIHGRQEP